MQLSQGRREGKRKGCWGPESLERYTWLCVKSSFCNQSPFKEPICGVREGKQECDITNGDRTQNEPLPMAQPPLNCLLHKHKVNVIIIIISFLFSFRLVLHQPENYEISWMHFNGFLTFLFPKSRDSVMQHSEILAVKRLTPQTANDNNSIHWAR